MKKKTRTQIAKMGSRARWAGRDKMLEDLEKIYDSMLMNRIRRWHELDIEVLWKEVVKTK